MNKELLDWIEEAYNAYLKTWDDNFDDENFKSQNGEISMMHDDDPNPIYVPYSKDEFIWQVKFEEKFAERWGIVVSKTELTTNQRMDYWFKNNKPNRDVCDAVDTYTQSEQHKYFDDDKVPKKLITLTYNNKTIEIYE